MAVVDMGFEGKVVLITDGTDNRGKAIAERFLQEGARLIINGIPETVNTEAIAAAEESRILNTDIDITKAAEIRELIQRIVDTYGRLDVLICNNDYSERISVSECTEESFDRVMDSNSKSAFFFTQAAGKAMMAAGCGKVIYIGSIHDEKPTGSAFVYSLSKGALKMLSHEAALELGRRGVTVYLVETGPMDNDKERFQSDLSGIYHDLEMKIPGRGVGTAADLTNLVYYLAGEETHYLNGTDIRMDGGFTLYYLDK